MTNFTYCNLEDFSKHYRHYIYGYLSLSVCIFGSLSNVINICVLLSKKMRSATNSILTALAVTDLLVMLQYIPFTIHRNLTTKPIHFSHYSYNWALFYKYNSVFNLIFHFIACVLTVHLAVWRYWFVAHPHANKLSERMTILVIILTYCICPLIVLPILNTMEIKPFDQMCDINGFMVQREDRAKHSQLIKNKIFTLIITDPYNLSIWVYTVLLKFLPCILLTLLSYGIIMALIQSTKRRIELLNSNLLQEKNTSAQKYRETQSDRTTRMLLAVLILFIITEFPQGLLGLISAILGNAFFQECYAPLGDIMDIVALINSSINFILYCSMSRQFRITFKEMLQLRKLSIWIRKSSFNNSKSVEDTAGDTKVSLV